MPDSDHDSRNVELLKQARHTEAYAWATIDHLGRARTGRPSDDAWIDYATRQWLALIDELRAAAQKPLIEKVCAGGAFCKTNSLQ